MVRDGFYGPAGAQRQRYRCYVTENKEDWHRFTPDLPRAHVHLGEAHCDACHEPIGVHRGEPAAARRQSWNLRIVAQALGKLADGETYTDVSEWAWRVTGRVRTRPAKLSDDEKKRRAAVKEWTAKAKAAKKAGRRPPRKPKALDIPLPDADAPRRRRTSTTGTVLPPRKRSDATKAANARWRTASDWVEMYSPAIWAPLEARLLAAEQADHLRRQSLDGTEAPGERRPMVLLLDDKPVMSKTGRWSGRGGNTLLYSVLTAGLVVWEPDSSGRVKQTIRMRLMRAYPANDAVAWRLLLDELGFAPGRYEPDFVVADAASGLMGAVQEHLPSATVIPSLHHLTTNVEKALIEGTKGARVSTDEGLALHPDLARHLAQLSAENIKAMDGVRWRGWWSDLLVIVRRLNLPTGPVAKQRQLYEARMAAALPAISANPDVPLSTGGYESVLRANLDGVLEGRAHGYRNLERLACLLDLVVAKGWGELDDINKVAETLRQATTPYQGWSRQPREVVDAQPPTGTYSSLRDPHLMRALAHSKGLC